MKTRRSTSDSVLFPAGTAKKLRALREMRKRAQSGNVLEFFDQAKLLVGHPNNDIRWQALIVVGEAIEARVKNDEIWAMILQHCGIDDDMQDALATVLIEHLLEHDFDNALQKLKAEARKGNAALVDALQRAWPVGWKAKANWDKVERLIRSFHARRRRLGKSKFVPLQTDADQAWAYVLANCGRRNGIRATLAGTRPEHLLEYDFDKSLLRLKRALREDNAPLIRLLKVAVRGAKRAGIDGLKLKS
jgi:hypothetical protein